LSTNFSRTTRSLAQDSSRFALGVWLIATIFLASWLVWFFFAKIILYEFSSKARLEVNRSSYPISLLVTGKVLSISVEIGQQVKAGEVLVTLDSSTEKLRLQEVEAKIKALPPQIAALEREIKILEQAKIEIHQAQVSAKESAKFREQEARSAVNFAIENEKRLKMLGSAGGIPVIETLRAHAESEKLRSNKAALTSEIQRLEMESSSRAHQQLAEIEKLRADVAKLNGELTTSNKTIARLNFEIQNHQVRSPVTGQVGEIIPLQVGTYVSAGEKLATIVPQSELSIVADFPPEAVLGRVHPGQHARMRLDGFPWMQFGTIPATVRRVGSEIRNNFVRVEFIPEKSSLPQIKLQHGLPGTIEVYIEEVSPAILVLRTASSVLTNEIKTTHSADTTHPS
jgi:membrane fusion protein (multidrug efflux system)